MCCVDSDLCDGLVTSSEMSYRVCVCVCECVRACVFLIVCSIRTSTMRRPRPDLDCCAPDKKGVNFSGNTATPIFPKMAVSCAVHPKHWHITCSQYQTKRFSRQTSVAFLVKMWTILQFTKMTGHSLTEDLRTTQEYLHSPAISSVPSILWPRKKMKENNHFSSQIIY